jgi:hypothetical protein
VIATRLHQVRGKGGVYLVAESTEQVEILAKLRKHKWASPVCTLSARRPLTRRFLEAFIAGSMAQIKSRHPNVAG